MPVEIGALTFLAVYANVFLRVYGQKLVLRGKLIPIFCNSWMIEVANIATILAMVEGGWSALPYTGMGAACGSVSAVVVHNWRIKNGRDTSESET